MASGSLNSSDVLAVSSFFLTAEVDDDDGVLLLDVSGGDVSENTNGSGSTQRFGSVNKVVNI